MKIMKWNLQRIQIEPLSLFMGVINKAGADSYEHAAKIKTIANLFRDDSLL